jgi:hypothetical protein
MQGLESEILAQEVILNFLVNILAFIFLGACLTGLVGVIIWITSGGNEGRNDKATEMFKSALGMVVIVLVFYFVIKLYANFMGISLK